MAYTEPGATISDSLLMTPVKRPERAELSSWFLLEQ